VPKSDIARLKQAGMQPREIASFDRETFSDRGTFSQPRPLITAELRGPMPSRFLNNPTDWAKRRETPLAGLSLLENPEHWHERAEKTRTIAGKVLDIDSKLRLMRIADEYNRLAKRARKHKASSRRH
jgi:hypothetical protein